MKQFMDKHRITLTLTALLAVLIICGLAILGQDWVQPEVTVPQIAEETGASQNQASIETDALAALPSVDLDGQPHAKREPVLASEVETAVLVTDIQGNPLAGFSLESRDWPRTRGWFNVEAGPPEISFLGVTDGDGLLDVSNQDPEAPLVLFSSDPSWAIIGESILPSSRQGLYGIRVREAGGVTGKVIAGGLPVSGATVGANVSIGFFQARTEGWSCGLSGIRRSGERTVCTNRRTGTLLYRRHVANTGTNSSLISRLYTNNYRI